MIFQKPCRVEAVRLLTLKTPKNMKPIYIDFETFSGEILRAAARIDTRNPPTLKYFLSVTRSKTETLISLI